MCMSMARTGQHRTLPGEREMVFLHFCSLKKRASKTQVARARERARARTSITLHDPRDSTSKVSWHSMCAPDRQSTPDRPPSRCGATPPGHGVATPLLGVAGALPGRHGPPRPLHAAPPPTAAAGNPPTVGGTSMRAEIGSCSTVTTSTREAKRAVEQMPTKTYTAPIDASSNSAKKKTTTAPQTEPEPT